MSTIQSASEALGLPVRHMYRLRGRYRLEGAGALAPGNRGRSSYRKLPQEVRDEIIELARKVFTDYNDYHLTDMLTEEYGLQVYLSSVRRIRLKAGLPSPRK